MSATAAPVSPQWLRLREGADAAARSVGLARAVRAPGHGAPWVVHDLGSGTGSMGRWLGRHLGGPQHWVLHDHDPALLEVARDDPPVSADGSPVTVETRRDDIGRLRAADLLGATLVTASALLDVLTADELEQVVRACVMAGVPALLTLSVTGRVRWSPTEPMDRVLGAAFDDHQRRTTPRGPLLGPDAPRCAVEAFDALGAHVAVRDSPWLLDEREQSLGGQWLEGWVAAAVEQRPELDAAAETYLARRTTQLRRGRARVRVHHVDLLAVPPGGSG